LKHCLGMCQLQKLSVLGHILLKKIVLGVARMALVTR